MSLYRIIFSHTAPKDHVFGTVCFLLASSDEDVYEWLKSEPKIKLPNDGADQFTGLYAGWEYCEEENEVFEIYNDKYDVIGTENFKEKIIRLKGQCFDDDYDFGDAYYGITLYGWEWVDDSLSDSEAQKLVDLGIAYRANREEKELEALAQ